MGSFSKSPVNITVNISQEKYMSFPNLLFLCTLLGVYTKFGMGCGLWANIYNTPWNFPGTYISKKPSYLHLIIKLRGNYENLYILIHGILIPHSFVIFTFAYSYLKAKKNLYESVLIR